MTTRSSTHESKRFTGNIMTAEELEKNWNNHIYQLSGPFPDYRTHNKFARMPSHLLYSNNSSKTRVFSASNSRSASSSPVSKFRPTNTSRNNYNHDFSNVSVIPTELDKQEREILQKILVRETILNELHNVVNDSHVSTPPKYAPASYLHASFALISCLVRASFVLLFTYKFIDLSSHGSYQRTQVHFPRYCTQNRRHSISEYISRSFSVQWHELHCQNAL